MEGLVFRPIELLESLGWLGVRVALRHVSWVF